MQLRNLLMTVLVALTMTGCDAIAGIFRAGFWVGIILVVLILALIGAVVSRSRR
jgi:hypothetical protein